jgi:hypothetical protein
MLKQFIERHKARRKAQYKRMNSEILCAITWQVNKDIRENSVNIPGFMEVSNRYNSLGIKTPKRLCEVYLDFYNQGLVSGIDL